MANLKKLNSDLRAAKKKKSTPASKTLNEKRDDAALEILRSINKSVTLLGAKLSKAAAPVINMPERKPVSYKASFVRNSRGDMVSAKIDPIIEKSGVK
jgi:hypothetical protein